MDSNYFETLGVSRDATEKEIKRAYFRKIREHPPEDDPEGFQRIRLAYEVIGDQVSRKSYEALLDHGGEIQALLQRTQVHWMRQEWQQLISLYQRILALDPSQHSARHLLAQTYAHLQRFDEAHRCLDRLIADEPQVPKFLLNKALLCLNEANSIADVGTKKHSLIAKARKCYFAVIEIDPDFQPAYMGLAECSVAAEQYDEAIEWCEKAIMLDGEVDFGDFEALFKICIIHIHRHSVEGVHATARRIEALVPDNPEIRAFVAMRFATIAHQLAGDSEHELSATFLAAARRFDAEHQQVAQIEEEIRTSRELEQEDAAIAADEQVMRPMRRLVRLGAFPERVPDEETRERQWRECVDVIVHSPNSEVRRSLEILLSKCPRFAQLNSELIGYLTANTAKKPSLLSEYSTVATMLVVAVLVVIGLAKADLWSERRKNPTRTPLERATSPQAPTAEEIYGEFRRPNGTHSITCVPVVKKATEHRSLPSWPPVVIPGSVVFRDRIGSVVMQTAGFPAELMTLLREKKQYTFVFRRSSFWRAERVQYQRTILKVMDGDRILYSR